MDLVAEAEGEDGEEAQVVEVVLQLVLLRGDVGLRDGAAVAVGVGCGVIWQPAREGYCTVGAEKYWKPISLSKRKWPFLGSILPKPMVARGTTLLSPKVKTPVP